MYHVCVDWIVTNAVNFPVLKRFDLRIVQELYTKMRLCCFGAV